MRREKTIGYLLIFIALAVLIAFFEDINTMINQAMEVQAESLVDQLLR